MAKQPRILVGQVAAITGAARGIGKATAQAFAARGHEGRRSATSTPSSPSRRRPRSGPTPPGSRST